MIPLWTRSMNKDTASSKESGIDAGLIAGGASSLFATIAGGFLEAGAAKAEGQFAANQFEFNQRMAEIQMDDALWRGEKNVENFRRSVRQKIGSQRASAAARGVDVNQGTAADLQEETAAFGEIDVITLRNNAYREAMGYKSQALEFGGQAERALQSGNNRATRSILSGIGQAANVSFAGYRSYRRVRG